MSDGDNELGFLFTRKINTLAALIYQSRGRIFDPDKDFRNSSHPEERQCWKEAVIAFSFINKDYDLLKHQ